ncbi:Serine/threonine-protein kinase PknD [compost metagenome]
MKGINFNTRGIILSGLFVLGSIQIQCTTQLDETLLKQPISRGHAEITSRMAYSELTQKLVDESGFIDAIISDDEISIAPGVTETDINYTDSAGRAMHLFILKVDLNEPQIYMEVSTPFNLPAFTRQTVPAQAAEVDTVTHKVIAGINGDFFDTSTGIPMGIVHKNGDIIKSTFNDNTLKPQQAVSFFGVTESNTPFIDLKTGYSAFSNQLYNGTGSGVLLVNNYLPVSQPYNVFDPRTSVGYDDNGLVYFVVVDGRNIPYSNGMNYAQLTSIFMAFDVKNAVNLDGGGSSTFMTRNPVTNSLQVRNQPSDGTARTVANAWLVYISKVTASSYAGTGTPGLINGAKASARFDSPEGLAIDATGNIYIADKNNHVIRKINSAGTVSTFAGTGVAGFADGAGSSAKFNSPWKVAVDGSGNVYVADRDNFKIRKITSSGVVSTLAGSTAGYTDGTGSAAKFMQPLDVALDPSGNVIVADNTNHRIRKVTPSGVVTTVAGNGTAGYANGTGIAAQFKNPSGVAVDASGNIYVADRLNYRIRKITTAGVVSSLAGNGTSGTTDAVAASAKFSDPYGITVDASGNVYVADLISSRIRKIASGQVTTISGSIPGDKNGTSTVTRFNQPTDLVIDGTSNIYVADHTNNKIRLVKLIN